MIGEKISFDMIKEIAKQSLPLDAGVSDVNLVLSGANNTLIVKPESSVSVSASIDMSALMNLLPDGKIPGGIPGVPGLR